MQKQIDPQIYEDGDKLPNFRAILLGDARVGKTSLITRFLNNSYKDTYTPTTDIM
jgi:GTPase SAR1 family protein